MLCTRVHNLFSKSGLCGVLFVHSEQCVVTIPLTTVDPMLALFPMLCTAYLFRFVLLCVVNCGSSCDQLSSKYVSCLSVLLVLLSSTCVMVFCPW